MPHSRARSPTLVLAALLASCAPPLELTTAQDELVQRCLKLAYEQEVTPECEQQVTKPMEKAFLAKHPDFYDQLLAARKAFVEARIAEDVRRRDDLNLCIDSRESGDMSSPACEKFMAHEITRGVEDRRRLRCAKAQLDGSTDAQKRCEGLDAGNIEYELQVERGRRERMP